MTTELLTFTRFGIGRPWRVKRAVYDWTPFDEREGMFYWLHGDNVPGDDQDLVSPAWESLITGYAASDEGIESHSPTLDRDPGGSWVSFDGVGNCLRIPDPEPAPIPQPNFIFGRFQPMSVGTVTHRIVSGGSNLLIPSSGAWRMSCGDGDINNSIVPAEVGVSADIIAIYDGADSELHVDDSMVPGEVDPDPIDMEVAIASNSSRDANFFHGRIRQIGCGFGHPDATKIANLKAFMKREAG